jgi:Rad3-related DNA helicase
LEGDKRLIFQSKGIPRGLVINFFRQSTEPRWLVSPSVWYGEDFPYESASVQVICKVPYGDLGNFLITARSIDKSRPWWYSYSTVQDFVQVLGRVVRAEDDYGESIILDAKFTDLYEKYWEFFPEGLREAIDDGGVIKK